jgi:hypothetical protein
MMERASRNKHGDEVRLPRRQSSAPLPGRLRSRAAVALTCSCPSGSPFRPSQASRLQKEAGIYVRPPVLSRHLSSPLTSLILTDPPGHDQVHGAGDGRLLCRSQAVPPVPVGPSLVRTQRHSPSLTDPPNLRWDRLAPDAGARRSRTSRPSVPCRLWAPASGSDVDGRHRLRARAFVSASSSLALVEGHARQHVSLLSVRALR